jgi:hypothetical protein
MPKTQPVTFEDLWKVLRDEPYRNEGMTMAYLVDLFRPSLFMRLKGIYGAVQYPDIGAFPTIRTLEEAKKEYREGRATLAQLVLFWTLFGSKKELTSNLKILRSERITRAYFMLKGGKPYIVRGRVVLPTG